MLTTNGKLLEFFVRILKLETDGSNWVIFKDRFVFAAAAANLEKHIDSMGTAPIPQAFTCDPTLLTADQMVEVKLYEENQSKWVMNEVVIEQAIATTITDSLLIEIRKEVTAHLMWEAMWLK